MSYWLGVDIGTTAVKVAAFSESGELLCQLSCTYEMFHPLPGQSEQDPDEITDKTLQCLSDITRRLLPARPAAIAFSAAMHSLIAVNEEGAPLTRCIIWADNRAEPYARALKDSETGKRFYRASGVPIHAMSPFCKLLWLKENDAALFHRAYKFIGIKEYIWFRLFGVYEADTSAASATGLLNLHTLDWDDDILQYLGINASRLSVVTSVKRKLTLSGSAHWLSAQEALKDAPFIIGGSDGALANLSMSQAGRQPLVATIGTSSAARILVDSPSVDKDMRTFCYHAMNDQYIVGGAGNNGAVVLEWLNHNFFEADQDMSSFLKEAEKAEPGCGGLIFLPYLLGERAPLWNARAKGVLFGLTIDHSRAHMIRAAMEAVIYSLYSFGKLILERHTVTDIHVTGGFAQNRLWVQMLADVFERPVVVSDANEGSAWGAIVIAREALGLPPVEKESQSTLYRPDPDATETYRRQFEQFERLMVLLKDEFI